MCKKIGIAVVAVLIGLFVVKKTDFGKTTLSHMRLFCKDAVNWSENQVSLEREIARLKMELTNLDKGYSKHIEAVAIKWEEVEKVARDVAGMKERLDKQAENITAMRHELESKSETFVIAGERMPRADLVKRLKGAIDSYELAQGSLEAKTKELKALETNLAQQKEQLSTIKKTRADMESELIALEAEVSTLKTAQLAANSRLDDSEYGKIREGIERVRERISVERKKLALQAEFTTGKPVATEKIDEAEVLRKADSIGKPAKVVENK
jgi:chromosome segregation ATPase